MKGTLTIVAVIFLGSAIAGCIGSEGASKDAGPTAAGDPQFDDTTGGIEGIVTNDESMPLPGAQVGILKLNAVTITDAEGRYVISNVPPGEYDVAAAALPYQQAAKRATVTAGSSVKVDFILMAVAIEGPFSRTISETVTLTGVMYKATPTCIYEPLTSINPRAKTCGGVRSGVCERCETHTASYKKLKEFDANWTTIVSELAWKPQSGATGRGFLLDVNAPNVTRGDGGSVNQASKYTWYQSASKAPLKIRIDKAGLAERGIPESDWNNYDGETCTAPGAGNQHCDWFWRIFPAYCDLGNCEQGFGPDYGIMVDGTATIYFSFFIKEPAKEGFSALPDA